MQAGGGLGDTQPALEEDLQCELDLTAGKKDVFLVDVSAFTLCKFVCITVRYCVQGIYGI